ncbi:MAG TPA: SDR family oxidoreductase [Holophagaceae bacterium]|nr:SDR family oxidoreductase [Holophagaceae bacterium]
MTRFAGKRILVTGAGSGIGRETARRLAAEGAELVLIGRRLDYLKETLPGARHVALDHADERAVAAFSNLCPELDGLFLNAGHLIPGSVQGTPVEAFDEVLSLNLRGPWLMAHYLGDRLKDGASVVLTGSNIGLRAIPDSAAYSVAKAGVHMLAKVLALEWAPRRIRCNAIAPGPVHTAMVDARVQSGPDPEGDLVRLGAVNPLKRMGTEGEVAALALHLLGEDSTWTTGTVIPIDGGAEAVY